MTRRWRDVFTEASRSESIGEDGRGAADGGQCWGDNGERATTKQNSARCQRRQGKTGPRGTHQVLEIRTYTKPWKMRRGGVVRGHHGAAWSHKMDVLLDWPTFPVIIFLTSPTMLSSISQLSLWCLNTHFYCSPPRLLLFWSKLREREVCCLSTTSNFSNYCDMSVLPSITYTGSSTWSWKCRQRSLHIVSSAFGWNNSMPNTRIYLESSKHICCITCSFHLS